MTIISILQYLTLMMGLVCLPLQHTAADIQLKGLKFTVHPMLYFSSEEVPSLQEKALTTHKKIADLLQDAVMIMLGKPNYYLPPVDYETFGGNWNEMYGNNLAELAMYCILFPEDDKALKFAIEYMDRMEALPKWQVISAPEDEVPVAHSLTGFVTAFDFLYPVLDPKRRMTYLRKIVRITKEFHLYSRDRSWSRFYLQNHVATNYLALIHGSLVVAVHYREALVWLKEALTKFEKTMKLLNHIVDGSLDEGVAYGSYTSRSVTQYIYLALRHFDIDHTKGFWIQQHFWFYYNTIMPKFQRTVGIGDSNNNWFYGPESQLVFLDAYILQNGYGNWLANEIRHHRTKNRIDKLVPAENQLWCTLHTEFIWFDAKIASIAPPQSGHPDLHVFHDWGVVTYSRVSPHEKDDTFLAFKCGKLHGRAVFDLVQRQMYSSWVNGWRSFNPGHEHPDQNMFVFAPSGQLFITDGLYAPKYTYLNNAFSFYPSPTSRCFQPWEGQLGECERYLIWTDLSVKRYGGELISASLQNGMVFTSGEAVEAYSSAMMLRSVYRSLLLLDPNLLIILDHIETKSKSPISHFSTFFHNLATSFEQHTLKGKLSGVKMHTDAGMMKMFWINDRGDSPIAGLSKKDKGHSSVYQPRDTNYVNITMQLASQRRIRVGYALLGPSVTLKELKFSDRRGIGTTLSVKTKQESYKVSIATSHDNPVSREQYLGYPGFVLVRLRNKTKVTFGFNTTSESSQTITKINHANPDKVIDLYTILLVQCVILIVVVLYMLRRRMSRRHGMLLLFTFASICLILSVRMDLIPLPYKTKQPFHSELPSVVITSLAGSGAELVGWLFYNNPDFAFVEVPSGGIKIPRQRNIEVNPFVDACFWTEEDLDEYPNVKSWVERIYEDLPSVLSADKLNLGSDQWQKRLLNSGMNKKNVTRDKKTGKTFYSRPFLEELKHSNTSDDVMFKEYTKNDLLSHVAKSPAPQTVLHFRSGSWGQKLLWLHGILGSNLRAIHVVRDPRAWVANFLRNRHKLYQELQVQQKISQMFKEANRTCLPRGRYAEEYDTLRKQKGRHLHLQLAHLWAANTHAALIKVVSLHATNARLVRFEDLVMNSEATAKMVYDFIGYPLRPTITHQLLQATHSDVFRIPYEGVVSQDTVAAWQQELSEDQIHDIEEVCGTLMETLKYKKIKDIWKTN